MSIKREMDDLYSSKSDPWGYSYANKHEIIVGLIKQFAVVGGEFLELGCGEGILTKKIPDIYKKFYTAVDVSEIAIISAKENNKNSEINWKIGRVEDYLSSIGGQLFNTVLVSDIITYLEVPKKKWFYDFIRILKPGGIYIETTWHSENYGACSFPFLEYQKDMETLFKGTCIILNEYDEFSSHNFYVGRKNSW